MQALRVRSVIGFIAVLSLAGILGCYLFVRHQLTSKDFKTIAASKVSDFLKADVAVEAIQIGMLNQVALSGLEVSSETAEKPFEFNVDKVVFHYDVFRMIRRVLDSPSTLLFQSPKVKVEDGTFPYQLFRNMNFGVGQAQVTKLQIEGGYVSYTFPNLKFKVQLVDLHGTVRPSGMGRITMDFTAEAMGYIEGGIRLQGEVDFLKRSHKMKITLDDVQLTEEASLPLKHVSGRLQWEDQNLHFENVSASVHGWKGTLNGDLRNFETFPDVRMDLAFGPTDHQIKLSLRANLETGNLWGAVKTFDDPATKFSGKIERRDQTVRFSEVAVDGGYLGKGWLDFESGDYDLSFTREQQRLQIASNLQNLNFNLNVQLDHFNFFGLDLVTGAQIRLRPIADLSKKRAWNFKGDVQTDYFVLETMPWDDFQGTFQINPAGIRDFRSDWGNAFALDGSVHFNGKDTVGKLSLKVDDFNLKDVREFASKPLPKELEGLVRGKLKINGSLLKPEIIGDFSVKNGSIGKLDYDFGVVHFRGFAPYLPLHESQISKGRTSLSLNGAIDLSLDNMFHGIQIQTPDHMVLWKGWHLNATSEGGDIELDTVMKKLPMLAVKAGLDSSSNAAADHDSFQDDRYVTVGPKIKF